MDKYLMTRAFGSVYLSIPPEVARGAYFHGRGRIFCHEVFFRVYIPTPGFYILPVLPFTSSHLTLRVR